MTFWKSASKLKALEKSGRRQRSGVWALLAPVLLLAPLELGAKGCDSAVVGDDCAVGSKDPKCMGSSGMGNTGGSGSAGSSSKGGNGNAGSANGGKVCGGLIGAGCDKGQYCNFPADAQCGAADQQGVCQSIPTACPANWNPVCGCDGVTYGNSCTAAAAGVSVASEGECASAGVGCGGPRDIACPSGQFCNYGPDAACGTKSTGTCEDSPEVCTDEYAPVCGCDNKTYATACEANAKGVSVMSKGECPPPGTSCNIKEPTCDKGYFCEFPAATGCGMDGKPGVCTKLAEVCDAIYAPVCGCDGKTYPSQCSAEQAGVSVAQSGECQPSTGTGCGGLKGVQCAKGQFCDYPVGTQCGAADQMGVCRTPPDACDQSYSPVCGCDGVTYSNPCMAAAVGVSVSSKGECTNGGSGKACGARLGNTCAKNEFCDFPAKAICGRADGTGTCKVLPNGCTKELNPVCGCDGVNYNNPCLANAAGTSVDPENLCKDPSTGGTVCGGLLGKGCADSEYCQFPADAQCGAADQTGVCTVKPTGCTAQYEPVCGCDGMTYGNPCEAASAGVSVSSTGACK